MSEPVTVTMDRDDAARLLTTATHDGYLFDAHGDLYPVSAQTIAGLGAALAAESAIGADTLERAAMEAVESWAHIRCDSRNDAPWRQLRDWQGFDATMVALMALVEDRMRAEAFAEDNAKEP